MALRLFALKNIIKPANPSLYYLQTRGVLDISGRGKQPQQSEQSPEQKTGTVGAKAEQNKTENQTKEDDPNSFVGKGSARGPSKGVRKTPQYGQGQN